MKLNLCVIFAGAEKCRSQINAFSYGFVSLVDVGQLLFVVKQYYHFFIVEDTVEEVTKVEPLSEKD